MGLVCLITFVVGCANDRAALRQAALDDTRRRADAVVQEVQAELAALRAEMAATRIAMAKKEAELRELRRVVKGLRAAQAKLVRAQVAQNRRVRNAHEAELTASSMEPKRAVNDQAGLNARVSAEAGITPPRAGETEQRRATVHARVKALEASVMALTTQLTQLTQEGTERDRPSPLSKGELGVRLTVKRGDTLWELARTYGVTVNAIQAANGLTGDLIVVGQRLLMPSTVAPDRSLSP